MKQLLCYGDSNTWGLIPGTHDRYPWGVRWTSILQRELEKNDVRIIEEGLCGRTTIFEDSYRGLRNGLETLPLILESHAPLDGVILMLGSNDCKSYYDLDASQIAKGIEMCIDKLLETIPSSNIILVSPIFLGEHIWEPGFDPEFNQKSIETSMQLPDEYRKLVDELDKSDHKYKEEVNELFEKKSKEHLKTSKTAVVEK